MLGIQFAFQFNKEISLSKLYEIHDTIVSRLQAILEEY